MRDATLDVARPENGGGGDPRQRIRRVEGGAGTLRV
jgi:hypothetical protein